MPRPGRAPPPARRVRADAHSVLDDGHDHIVDHEGIGEVASAPSGLERAAAVIGGGGVAEGQAALLGIDEGQALLDPGLRRGRGCWARARPRAGRGRTGSGWAGSPRAPRPRDRGDLRPLGALCRGVAASEQQRSQQGHQTNLLGGVRGSPSGVGNTHDPGRRPPPSPGRRAGWCHGWGARARRPLRRKAPPNARLQVDGSLTELDNPGRWMAHCHILAHAELGMMTELVVHEWPRAGDTAPPAGPRPGRLRVSGR